MPCPRIRPATIREAQDGPVEIALPLLRGSLRAMEKAVIQLMDNLPCTAAGRPCAAAAADDSVSGWR